MVSALHPVSEAHDLPNWELVFRFTSGGLCLAFCATVGERWRRGFERLRTLDGARLVRPVPVDRHD